MGGCKSVSAETVTTRPTTAATARAAVTGRNIGASPCGSLELFDQILHSKLMERSKRSRELGFFGPLHCLFNSICLLNLFTQSVYSICLLNLALRSSYPQA